MRQRGLHHIRFTPQLWAKWLARFNGDAYSMHLREGIQEFRALLAKKRRR